MKRRAAIPILCLVLGAAPLLAQTQPPPAPAPAAVPGSVELDHVVAIVGANVILESDVALESRFSVLEPLQVLPGQNTPAAALRRLIDRTLILQQMEEQRQPIDSRPAEVKKAVAQLRREIPACRQYDCETDEGWEGFLRASDLTEQMVEQRWSQRMAILRFIDLRFRSGIRIAPDQISAYYQKTLVPALEKNHETAPALSDVSGRIQEILLEQQVSGLFQDWLSSLRDQGNIRIVDEAYSVDLKLPGASGQGDQSQ